MSLGLQAREACQTCGIQISARNTGLSHDRIIVIRAARPHQSSMYN